MTSKQRSYPQLESLRSHRSIRHFTDEPVTDEQLEAIITTGQRASTSSNLQAYSVIAVRDREKKIALAELCGGQGQIVDCSVFLLYCTDLNRATLLCEAAGLEFAPRCIEQFLLAVVDATIFAQTVLAAAEAIGLGGCMIGGARNRPYEIARLLELSPRVFVIFGMTLGHPRSDRKTHPLKPRLPVEAVLHRERYDASDWPRLHATYDEIMRQAGLYRNRRVDLSGRIPGWTEKTAEDDYSWSEHSARRWVDPAACRTDLRPFLDQQGFGFE